MTRYHVLAGIGETAEELISLGVFEASTPREALERCLASIEDDTPVDPVADISEWIEPVDGLPMTPERFAELELEERRSLRTKLREADVTILVAPTEHEALFVRGHSGEIREAADEERRRAMMRRDFGIDIV